MNLTVLLKQIDQPALAVAGGKGANLAALAQAGFPVPPGFCVTTAAYDTFVSANQLADHIDRLVASTDPENPESLEQASSQIRALFEHSPVPQKIADAIYQSYRTLSLNGSGNQNPNLPAVAVRSSATAEDLPDMSFAGQQDTYLNMIGEQSVLSAVVGCWSSLWTARAIGYRARNKINHRDVSLAVVVQVMVQSEVSGVLFTANPLTGKRSETVVDASFGLGEAIVSGMVEPDHYEVDTTRHEIMRKDLGAKQTAVVSQEGGGTITAHKQAGTGSQALPDPMILELAQLGQQIAERFGSPQDIEWACAGGKLYILQSRPITSLFPIPERLKDNRELKILFSFSSVQGILDPLTPLGLDMMGLFACSVVRVFGQECDRNSQPVFYTAAERIFINFTGAYRHKPWRKFIFFFMGAIDPMVQQVFYSLKDDPRLSLQNDSMRLRTRWITMKRIAAILTSVIGNIANPIRGRQRLENQIRASISRIESVYQASTSMKQHVELIDEAVKIIPDILFTYLLPAIISGQMMFQPLLRLASRLPGGEKLAMELTRGLPHNVTTEMDLALWRVSQKIQEDVNAAAYMQQRDAVHLAQEFLEGNLPPAAQHPIEEFLQRYGMRGFGEIDLGRPRWREDPTQIMQVLSSYLKITNQTSSPQAVFDQGAVRAGQARQELIAALRRSRLGWIKARYAAFASRRVRELVGLRETPKFTAIRMMGIVRAALLQDGKELATRGILNRADDVFFLHIEELSQLATGADRDWKGIIDRRRQRYLREKTRKQIPRLLLSDGTAYYESFSEHASASGNQITGSPVSPGVVEGIAHVILDPRGAQLSPGEILVCPATDPGWTPLFLAAGGLVMEMGGMMTHGSVVAREYGIPAVVGVPHATTRIITGQRLRIDGLRGVIEIIAE